MAQNGRASGSFADNAAVPSPCALYKIYSKAYNYIYASSRRK